MIDSDNVLVGTRLAARGWCGRSRTPTVDLERGAAVGVPASRPLHQPLPGAHGINDPLALFVGNYDRLLDPHRPLDRLPVKEEARDGWLRVTLDPRWVPTMGANGYIVRRDGVRRRAGRRVPVRHRLRARSRAGGPRHHRSCRRADPALLLRQRSALLPQDPPARRRLLLLRRDGATRRYPWTDAPARGRRPLRRLDGDGRPAARPGRTRAAPTPRSGVAVPCARMLDHARRLRRRHDPRQAATADARSRRAGASDARHGRLERLR